MLSLMRTGIPCSGPRGPFALRSRSSSWAMVNASGFDSMIEFNAGPRLSICCIRARYFSASDRALAFPDVIARWRSWIVTSSSSKALSFASREVIAGSDGLLSPTAEIGSGRRDAPAAIPEHRKRLRLWGSQVLSLSSPRLKTRLHFFRAVNADALPCLSPQ